MEKRKDEKPEPRPLTEVEIPVKLPIDYDKYQMEHPKDGATEHDKNNPISGEREWKEGAVRGEHIRKSREDRDKNKLSRSKAGHP